MPKQRKSPSHPNRLEFWAAWAAVIGTLIAGASFIIGIWKDVRDVRGHVRDIEKQTTNANLVITYPTAGAKVGLEEIVVGSTPYRERRHYVVVSPAETGDQWVQSGPIRVSNDESLMGRTVFGTAGAGAGKGFTVRILATTAEVAEGPLRTVPDDAAWSNVVYVTRREE